MADFVLKFNYAGIGELLRSEWAAEQCIKAARDVARRAGSGYAVADPHQTGQRVAVNVYASTKEACRDAIDNNTLLRALK